MRATRTLYIPHTNGRSSYVFIVRADERGKLLRTIGRYAMDKELDFDWWDAATVSRKVRALTVGAT